MLRDLVDRARALPWLQCWTIAAALMLANCDVTHTLQVISAGQTGCAPGDIRITDDEPGFNSRSWVAWCNSERYQCFGAGNSASCTAPPKPAEAVEAAPPRRAAVTWVSHEVKSCGVTADFPGEPTDEASELKTKTGPVKVSTTMFELSGGRGEVSISCSPVLEKKSVPASVVLNGARDGMLKNIGATLTGEREIISGREILFEVHGERGLAHLLWINQRVILATAMPLRTIGSKSAKRFVNSVQIADEG